MAGTEDQVSSTSPPFADVIVVGAGPAGTTAALLLARAGRRVVLLDGAKFPRAKQCAGWLNARATALIAELGLPLDNLITETIDNVTFCNSDLSKTTRPRFKSCPGYLVDRLLFDQRLTEAAEEAGVAFHDQHLVTRIRPLERGVELSVRNRDPVAGRLLVVASGLASAPLAQVGIHLPAEASPVWSAHVEQLAENAITRPRVTVVVGVGAAEDFCMGIDRPDRSSLTLYAEGDKGAVSGRLAELARTMAQRGLLSQNLSKLATAAPSMPAVPYSALDMESHVGKHTLVIGDAGGFLASTSREGIYPAMWSASIAVRVINEACRSTFSQDALMTFDTEWRLEMGDFLRPPNTDLQLLMPLIFTNQPMADRMAAVFFAGENI